MNHRSRQLAPIALLALALQLALSLPVAPGLVLCVGSDGHVAVESGGCADESPGTAGDCEEFGKSTPCTDTPLAARELRSGAGPRGAHDAAPALAPAFDVRRFVTPAASVRRVTASPPAMSPTQRSTILRL